ncbi:Fatty acyl-CoA reductase 1 [Hypsibius exemplaris]|uniref:Fatty acyl-CoA reductase n=1 Tax=Hypsibius exemplaris TaxID=2072580 RepID=A0A1W0X9D9_HYPEX|nr:Fatty acyl-CoA reductase 1 [Hypsibius exemplaris]
MEATDNMEGENMEVVVEGRLNAPLPSRPPQSSNATSPVVPPSRQTIDHFYRKRFVFVTGASGFIGKVLLEKLLRCCPEIAGIFILMRPKKGRTPFQRVEDLCASPIFKGLREVQPAFNEKLIAMQGDVNEEDFGLHSDNLRRLLEETSVVFHVAATIRFDEPLKYAIEMNVISVQRLVGLCRRMTRLKALVHVSTAYANCDRNHIEEMVYQPSLEPQKLIDIIGLLPDKAVEAMTPHLLKTFPNTYCFTKGLAEYCLLKEAGDLPLAIVRPSIVGAAWKEPIPGWIDNSQGPSLLFIANGKGLLRSMTGHRERVMDVIPVDFTANLLIAVGWRTARIYDGGKGSLTVYNGTSGGVNPLKWGELESNMVHSFAKNPLDLAFRRPKMIFTEHPLMRNYWSTVSHLLPAYIFDMALRLVGKKPSASNVGSMMHEMSSGDREVFYLDAREVHWPSYIENYCLGMKKFLLKEDLDNLPRARRHQRRLNIVRYAFNTVLLAVIWRFVIANSRLAGGLWHMVLNLVFKFVRFFRMTSSR